MKLVQEVNTDKYLGRSEKEIEDDLMFIDSKFDFLRNVKQIDFSEKKQIKESFESKLVKKKLDFSKE